MFTIEAASSPCITSDSSFLPSSSFTHSMNFELYRATTPATGLSFMSKAFRNEVQKK